MSHLNDPIAAREHAYRMDELDRLRERNSFTSPVDESPAIRHVVLGNETYLTAGGACFGPVFDVESYAEAEGQARAWVAEQLVRLGKRGAA